MYIHRADDKCKSSQISVKSINDDDEAIITVPIGCCISSVVIRDDAGDLEVFAMASEKEGQRSGRSRSGYDQTGSTGESKSLGMSS